MLYCGMDLHAKESFLYVIDHRGRRDLVKRVLTQTRSIKESLGPLVRRRLKFVLEASTMTNWAIKQLRAVGADVVVVDPRRVRLIAKSRRKKDRADARVLPELALTGALPLLYLDKIIKSKLASLDFAGGSLTPPLTKGMLRPLGSPAQGSPPKGWGLRI